MSRADRFTITDKQIEYYTDFTNNFDLNPITGLLAKVSNEESIKQALKNLILTKRTERFYNQFIGTRINSMLFEPLDNLTAESLRTEIQTTIQNNEPRVKVTRIDVIPNEDLNAYNVIIQFYALNKSMETVSLELILKRVR